MVSLDLRFALVSLDCASSLALPSARLLVSSLASQIDMLSV
jgi:hypothetical protein